MEITLRNKVTSPTVDIRLTVDSDQEGNAVWREFRAPALPARQTQGPLQFSHLDPLQDFVWAQQDWSDGAFKVLYEDGDKRYTDSNGMDLRWEGVMTNGNLRSTHQVAESVGVGLSYNFIIKNPGAETADITGWTAGTGVTLTADAAAKDSGNYGFKIVTDGSRSNGDVLAYQDLQDASLSPMNTVWQGKPIGCEVRLKRASGSESGIKAEVDDGVAQDTSPAVTSSSFTARDASLTANGSANKYRIQLIHSGDESGSHTFYADTWKVDGITDYLVAGANPVEVAGGLYMGFTKGVVKWDESNLIWRVVHYQHAYNPVTDIIGFNGVVYVAHGTASDYYYGIDTTWTASSRTPPDDKAVFWTIARNASGADALWKAETTAGNLCNTTDGTNSGPGWSAPITVGDSGHDVTKLYGEFDTLVVAKEDGFYTYTRWDPNNSSGDNLFQNITTEFSTAPDDENFTEGQYRYGWLYLKTAINGFVRWRPGAYEDLGDILFSPRASELGGTVMAMAADPNQIYIGVNSPDLSANKLVSLRDVRGQLKAHILTQVESITIRHVVVYGGYVWVIGLGSGSAGFQGGIITERWLLPSKSKAPYAADNHHNLKAVFTSQVWNGGMPDTVKAFTHATLWNKDISSTRTAVLKYGLDGASPSTTTLGTYNAATQVQTKYFHDVANPETTAVGRSIQYELTLTATGATAPQIWAVAIHSTLRPRKLRTWEFSVRIEKEGMQSSGFTDPVDWSAKITDLHTLEDQPYSISFEEDWDNDGTFNKVQANLTVGERTSDSEGYEVHKILLQEALTTA